MTSDEEPSEDASAKTSPPKSRFDEFLERLDEREARRDRPSEGRDDRAARTDTGAEVQTDRAADAEPATEGEQTAETTEEVSAADAERKARVRAEAEAEVDGWIWGSPKEHDRSRQTAETLEGDPRSGGNATASADEDVIDRIDELSRASERDEERIWDVIDDGAAEPAEDQSPAEADSSEDDEVTTAPESSRPTGSSGTGDGGEPAESENRWKKLGANFLPSAKRSAEDSVERQTESVEPIPSAKTTGGLQTNAKTTDDAAVSGSRSPGTESALSGGNHSSLDQVAAAESVLVLGPTGRSISDVICSEFLVGEQGSRDVIFVTFDESPDDRLDVCHRSEEWAGGEIGIIEVGRGSRGSPVISETTTGGAVGSITVRHVSKPGDLSKLGIVITRLLGKFDETPRQTVLCFHTLSALHNHVNTKTLFRFLNTLQGRLRSANAVGHYHMDPDLHDEIVIETLRPIFDSTIRYSADGELEIE